MFDEGAARKTKPDKSPKCIEQTKHFAPTEFGEQPSVRDVLSRVANALTEKGYRPVDQLVGFLVTGDPAYITSYGEARLWVKKLERDEILEEVLRDYLSREGESKGR